MSIDKKNLAVFIRAAIEESDLPLTDPSVFEKDYYVTEIIHRLADVHNDYFNLIFTGGTSLAKAHRLVMRMSEDVDFRIQSSKAADTLNPSQRRKEIKAFRKDVLYTL